MRTPGPRSSASAVLLVALAMAGTARAQADIPEVQLYTMGEGDASFERFGHAAMCLHYKQRRTANRCYNYGTTDFQTPVPLTWSFLRGEADFWVATAPPGVMLRLYRGMDRSIWRQDLPLTDDQARLIAKKLRHNARPENRHFTYHHFHDNCSTRLRDLIDEATSGRLREGSDHSVGVTYRDLVRRGFSKETVIVVGSDVVLGRAVDQVPTRWQAMFLPAYLREEVRTRLGAEPATLVSLRIEDQASSRSTEEELELADTPAGDRARVLALALAAAFGLRVAFGWAWAFGLGVTSDVIEGSLNGAVVDIELYALVLFRITERLRLAIDIRLGYGVIPFIPESGGRPTGGLSGPSLAVGLGVLRG